MSPGRKQDRTGSHKTSPWNMKAGDKSRIGSKSHLGLEADADDELFESALIVYNKPELHSPAAQQKAGRPDDFRLNSGVNNVGSPRESHGTKYLLDLSAIEYVEEESITVRSTLTIQYHTDGCSGRSGRFGTCFTFIFQPLSSPPTNSFLQGVLDRMSHEDWKQQYEGLSDLRRLSKHHTTFLTQAYVGPSRGGSKKTSMSCCGAKIHALTLFR